MAAAAASDRSWRSFSILAAAAMGLSVISTTALVVFYFADRISGPIRPEEIAFVLPVILTTAALVAMLAATTRGTYRIAQVLRYLTGAAVFAAGAGGYGGGSARAELLFLSALVFELTVLESYPWNLIGGTAAVSVVLALRSSIALVNGGTSSPELDSLLSLAVPGYGIALLGALMVRFRELVVELQTENDTLQEVVVNMARANTRYQSVAVIADERGRSQERRRITRDIHDVVGYTLTNNIMLMETARDMMQENPLGIPKLIESARANAEEGLARIREALYDLRRQEDPLPIGLAAIQRLVGTFADATGVDVRLDWANTPAMLSDEVDSTLYHLIQESLINSYRHGRVTTVEISCWRERGTLNVYIRDDGAGATEIKEGIGISGMRERIGILNGTLSASSGEHGFLIEATIPLAGGGECGGV